MPATNDKQNTSPVRVAVREQNEARMSGDPGDPGDSMWPLTSEGAAMLRGAHAEKPSINIRRAHPAVPRTLCETDGNDCDCSGWIAEPLS